jgi:two-component system sensor histidine kinase/response regulator
MTQSAPIDRGFSEHAVRAAPVRPNILIVDDRQENLFATEKVLRSLDAGILKAMSGNEALSLMLRHKFAVVLLDVQMPEMDGFETAKLMQEQESMRGTPIIFVTAISKEDKYATQAAEIGAVDYVFKPINSEILKSKVKVYLDIYVQREQILNLNAGLRQSNEELERFAYICSHDMQEPVRMMNSYAELLEKKYSGGFDDNGRKYIAFITSSARQLSTMIKDILNFSRVGREEIKLENVDCNEIARDVLGEFETLIEQKKADVAWGILPVVRSNPSAETWQFSVTDNGIGIDPQQHRKVFTIFQRLHRKDQYPGTGIGLSTCRKFIELCDGRIWFESTPGQGSAFFFTLPCQAAS